MEIRSHGDRHRHRRMGQYPSRIVSLVRDSQFQRHQALARRRKMAWARLELLVRHVAVLFVEDMSRISWLVFLLGLFLTAIIFYRDVRRSGWKPQLTGSFGRFLVSPDFLRTSGFCYGLG